MIYLGRTRVMNKQKKKRKKKLSAFNPLHCIPGSEQHLGVLLVWSQPPPVARLSPQVHLHATYGDPFWRRVEAPHKVDGDNLLSSICVFGLDRKFDSVFESNVEGRTPIYSLPLVSINFGDSNVARMLIERGAAVSAAV